MGGNGSRRLGACQSRLGREKEKDEEEEEEEEAAVAFSWLSELEGD